MAITLTLFYGSPNAYNGAAASLGFDCPRKPKIKRAIALSQFRVFLDHSMKRQSFRKMHRLVDYLIKLKQMRRSKEVSVDELQRSVEHMHGGTATLVQSVPVRETFEGQLVWEGVVHVFDLEGSPQATRAYAWSSPIEGSTKRRFFAVLHIGPVKSPANAVRAAIVAEQRRQSWRS